MAGMGGLNHGQRLRAWTSSGCSYRLTFDGRRAADRLVLNQLSEAAYAARSHSAFCRDGGTTLNGRLGDAMVVIGRLRRCLDRYRGGSGDDRRQRHRHDPQGVLLLTYRTNTAYLLTGGLAAKDLYTSHNSELASAAQRHKSLKVLDWDTYSTNHPEWFAADGVHLTLSGANALAAFIENALDALPGIGRCRAANALTGSVDSATAPAALRSRSGLPLLTNGADTRTLAGGAAAAGRAHRAIDVSKSCRPTRSQQGSASQRGQSWPVTSRSSLVWRGPPTSNITTRSVSLCGLGSRR